ncbi:hypothetical protein ACSQ67_009551 [Phaseolus vulgaris]
MLHRSFKPAKCKTALKLAVSRVKLLRNKREAQVRQLKRELAQLLESGQDRTARIRVEHVVREEKTMAAYDLVEIYCELIAARLPMIESQKNCPIDLKEAVSSVIFASPRCSDVPELVDVKKQLTSKYGKEFVSAAVELRPDCGVSRMLVEKLSAKAPDGPTKIKILAAIAEEHNIKWEPKSFEENDVKSSQDLLVGPSTSEKAAYAEPSQIPVLPVHDEKGPSNVRASSQVKPMHHVSANSHEQTASAAARKDQEIRSSGTGSQETDFLDSYTDNRSAFSMNRQNWTMEFKDAASAAQAAAESAERASMAARAAAELSNRENMTRQYSSGSHSSSGNGLRDERPQGYTFHDDKDISTSSVDGYFHRSSSETHNEQISAREQDNLVRGPSKYYPSSNENVVKHSPSGSLKSGSAFGDDKPFTEGSEMADIYHHKNSFEQKNSDSHEISSRTQAGRNEEAFVTELYDDTDLNTENNYHFGDVRTNKPYREASSSHLVTPTDDHNDNLDLNGWKTGNKAVEDLFVADEANAQRNFMGTSSYNDTSVLFDDSGSEDGDDYKFDVDKKYSGEGSGLFVSSPGARSQVDSWRHGQNVDEKVTSFSTQSHFSEASERLTASAVSSEKEDLLLPVTFDDSDDPGSDSDVDLVKSKHSGLSDYENSSFNPVASHGDLGSSSRNDKNMGTDRKSWLSPSVGSDTIEEHFETRVDTATVSEKNFGYDDDVSARLPSTKERSSSSGLDLEANNDTETLEEFQAESGKELSYGTLKGGLRNKGLKRPPYIKNTLDDVSSSLGNTSIQNEKSLPTGSASIGSDTPVQDKYTREVRRGNKTAASEVHNISSDSNSYRMVANSQETLASTIEPRIQKEQSEAKNKSSSRPSVTYFDSDNSDFEDELPKQNSPGFARPLGGISRRTSASPKAGTTGLSSRDAPLSKPSVTPATTLGWKSSRTSYENSNQNASSMTRSSENWTGSKPGSAKNKATEPVSEPKRSLHGEVKKSTARLQPSSSPKTVIQDNKEGQDDSNADTSSNQKVGHVHPKLPDYDSFAAHFLSLKKDRP